MTAADPLQTIIDLFVNGWNSSNTDSNTPNISKITDIKRIDFNANKDWILIHRSNPLKEPAGIGVLGKHITENLIVDVRTQGIGMEDHWRNVLQEVERILDASIISPSSDYTILNPDSQGTDLSDKMFNTWRMLVPIKLIKYNQSR
jgi:hypothetical protein